MYNILTLRSALSLWATPPEEQSGARNADHKRRKTEHEGAAGKGVPGVSEIVRTMLTSRLAAEGWTVGSAQTNGFVRMDYQWQSPEDDAILSLVGSPRLPSFPPSFPPSPPPSHPPSLSSSI